MSEWRDISTAPQDRRGFWVGRATDVHGSARCEPADRHPSGRLRNCYTGDDLYFEPTHWAPFPSLPGEAYVGDKARHPWAALLTPFLCGCALTGLVQTFFWSDRVDHYRGKWMAAIESQRADKEPHP